MLTTLTHHETIPDNCDVCIVGAAPVGMALTLSCERSGLSVLLLQSRSEQPDRFAATLTSGHTVDAEHHQEPGIVMCGGLGETSRW